MIDFSKFTFVKYLLIFSDVYNEKSYLREMKDKEMNVILICNSL